MTPPADVPLVFLDTETTSLRRRTRRVWDVAAIRRDPDGVETRLQAYVADVDLNYAVREALDVGQFYERHPRYAPPATYPDGSPPCLPEAEVAAQVAAFTHGAYLVGIVPSFDEESLDRMLVHHGLEPAWHWYLTDAAVLAAGQLGVQPPYDWQDLARSFGVRPDNYAGHTALGDALLARDLYDAVMLRARSGLVIGS